MHPTTAFTKIRAIARLHACLQKRLNLAHMSRDAVDSVYVTPSSKYPCRHTMTKRAYGVGLLGCAA